MDLENQRRVKEFTDQYGAENIVVLLGAAEGEAAGLAAETVTLGDPTFAGPLAGVSLKLSVYHICEPEVKAEIDPAVYDEQISMMEMVLDVDDICSEMNAIREQAVIMQKGDGRRPFPKAIVKCFPPACPAENHKLKKGDTMLWKFMT